MSSSTSDLNALPILELSSKLLDEGITEVRPNRITNQLSEVADDLAVVESFSHSVVFRTDDGLVAFDASAANTGPSVVDALRSWSTAPLDALVYTHGHVDHVGGSGAFLADNATRGHAAPTVIGHEAIVPRFERYRDTNGYNLAINDRQFGGGRALAGAMPTKDDRHFLPTDVAPPTTTFETSTSFTSGSLEVELHHAKGETDDHAWAWVPSHRAICSGDLMVWVFPNAGNPQKVQRFPREWAAALREMVAREPELLLPAHALPITGKDRIARVLTTTADVLDDLVDAVVEMMNQGATLDDVLHTVKVPADKLALPFLRPTYDEPEFMVRNIWRLYGGWWGGDPADLKPAPDEVLAAELTSLAGGATALAARAMELAEADDLRLACHLIELAARAAGGDPAVHEVRSEIYTLRRRAETSLMAKGVFGAAARESQDHVDRHATSEPGTA